jgi:hypothetical protein
MPKKYQVAVLEHEDDLKKNFTGHNWREEIDSENTIKEAAEAIAQKAYDDWANENIEKQWPVTFLVADEEGNIAKVEVSLELEPVFWADKVEENAAHLK